VTVLLLSTYELGRQPFGLASPAAWLREAGFDVVCVDLARQPLPADTIRAARLVGVHLPMHTATRLALPVIDRVRAENPAAGICGFGLYAPLNEALLRARGVGTVLGGEFEADLVALARGLEDGTPPPDRFASMSGAPPRLAFRTPDRAGLPPLARYAAIRLGDGTRRVTGYTEASRGCRHRCRHCPIVPVYDGRFRVVPADVVLADIRAQVDAGAQHVTFGDPDFLNGPRHALDVARRVARAFPGLTFDVTIKVEHLLAHAGRLPELRAAGCVLVTSAVESFDDAVLARLDKGHTRDDAVRAIEACRAAGLALAPTFVPFTPWTTRESYRDLLQTIVTLDLVEAVAPIQLAIRLLVPEGSRLLALDDIGRRVARFDPVTLTYPWRHADPEVDRLQARVIDLVGRRPGAARGEVFEDAWRLAHAALDRPVPAVRSAPVRPRATVPYLDEPWYC